MAMTLPVLIGAWKQQQHEQRGNRFCWRGRRGTFVGVFMAAARTHMITVASSRCVDVHGRLVGRQWMRWVVAVLVVGYVVAGDARFQRFTTLQDRSLVSERIAKA
jgi:hypothetical protein